MFSEHAIKLATEYLDRCFKNDKQATLVGMLNHVDYFDRVVMELDEINAALSQRPSVFVHRTEGQIEFRSSGVERTITEDDLQRGIEQYHEYFRAQLEKLNAKKLMGKP
jgi:hypothetical protein